MVGLEESSSSIRLYQFGLRAHLNHQNSDIICLLHVSRCLLKSPASDRRWSDNVFISRGNPHITSWFCGVVLGSTTSFKMVSEPPPRSIRFRYRVTHHLCPRSRCLDLRVRGCVKELTCLASFIAGLGHYDILVFVRHIHLAPMFT
jgi:hypothetical protein